MNRSSCYKRFPYSVSDCAADQNICFQAQRGNGFACPYNICRDPVADFCMKNTRYALLICVAFLIIHMVAVCLSAKIISETSDNDNERKPYIVDIFRERSRRSISDLTSKDGESPRIIHLKNLCEIDSSPVFSRNSFLNVDGDESSLHPSHEPVLGTSLSPVSSPSSLKYFFCPHDSGDNGECENWKVIEEDTPVFNESDP